MNQKDSDGKQVKTQVNSLSTPLNLAACLITLLEDHYEFATPGHKRGKGFLDLIQSANHLSTPDVNAAA